MASDTNKITIRHLQKMHENKQKIAALTAYDATFARLAAEAGCEILLIGDSLGMVVQGHETTLPVKVNDIAYHIKAVKRAHTKAFIIADMPFGSFGNTEQALRNSVKLMQAGADMVKLELTSQQSSLVKYLTQNGVPVCAHIGLKPQHSAQQGGYFIAGKHQADHQQILNDAKTLVEAGSAMLLVEAVPEKLGSEITRANTVPVIGIGAGAQTSAQILVIYDMLGLTPSPHPRFVRNFMDGKTSIQSALSDYVEAVKAQTYPAANEQYSG